MFSHSLVIDEENVRFIMKLARAVQEAQKSMLIWPASDFQLIFGFFFKPWYSSLWYIDLQLNQ